MRAVLRMRGRRRSISRPGASARKSCMAPTPMSGKMAMYSATKPMPPSQCVKLRQNSRPFGRDSTSGMTLDPVPENPLTVSNQALTGSSPPASAKGSAPSAQTMSQPRATAANPSRRVRPARSVRRKK